MKEFIAGHKEIIRRCLVTVGLVALAALFVVLAKQSIKVSSIENIVYSIHPHNEKYKDDIYFEKVLQGKVIEQYVNFDSDMDGIALDFHADSQKDLAGETYVKMFKKDTNELVYEDTITNNKVALDGLYHLNFYDGKLPAGRYIVTVTSNVTDEKEALYVYMQNEGLYPGMLIIDGNVIDGKSLCITSFQYTKFPTRMYKMLIVLGIMAVAVSLAALYVFKLPNHISFFVACIMFGGVYMAMIGPGKGCDSGGHYLVCYDYANQILLKGSMSANNGIVMREEDAAAYKKNFYIYDNYNGVMSKDGFMDIKDSYNLFVEDADEINTGIIVQEQNFVPYIPYILGLVIGRIFHLGAIPCMYLARAMALLMFSCLIAMAIKITPVGKEVFFLIALLPMNLHEFSAFSYDGMCIAAGYLFIACWLDCLYGDKNNKTTEKIHLACWVVAAILLGASKQGAYILFILLMVAVTKAYAGWKRKTLVVGGMVLSAVIFNAVKYLLVFAESIGLVIMAGDGSKYMPGSSYTLDYALHHPWKFFIMCIGSIVEKADYYFGSTFGTHLTANTQILPLAVVIPFVVLIVLVCFNDENDIILDARAKVALFVTMLANCFALFFMMQVSTPVGWNIDGVTGRYFLPLLPMMFLLLNSTGITIKKDAKQKVVMGFLWWHIVEIFYATWFVLTR